MDWYAFPFFLEVTIGGLLSGVMYAMAAIGFVLICKTSGVLNFAQGAMVLFAAPTFVSPVKHGFPFPLAIAATLIVMTVLGFVIDRTALRPLANRSPMVLFMAASGLSYVIEGLAQPIWGTQVHRLALGISNTSFEIGGIFIPTFDLVAAAMFAVLTIFFRFTRTGPGFRAVADDQFAGLAVGLRLDRTWATVWTAAGFVALAAGLLWGARLGAQFSLSLIVLKALPVLVLGGFGSILAGLPVGTPKKLAEPYLGGAQEIHPS
ncbi:branched-chain amino acid ABC transporter permease [Paracoccus kondratievae]|uniref:Branched-chain amino acid ABC transporter permease n=1 Tax=Paracoccus kondratievae TaxID=135740 RepID=A0AAD3P1M1_9RHOB|nr:branched-chain amino acid ABC transporter permease [Paracoccus kondratievae]GLK65270.1 branched-chain amino acid ABC transporter permease [Paracoccus kondratievae]